MNKTEVDCSNQIHQLMVTVSRHFYVSQKGILTYQDKPFTTKINNYQNSKKELLVYYIVIDRYSGNFIFQVATTKQLFALADFLHYAWRQDKEEKHFWGLPDYIAIPKAISSPSLFVGLKQVGVTPFTPTSGFPSGGHIIKAIEDHLWSQLLFRSTLHFKASIEIYKTDFYDVILGLASRGDSRTIWKENLPSGQPNDTPIHQEFIHAFKTKESDSTTLPLILGDKSTNITTRIPPSTELPHYFVAPVKKLPFSETKLNEANEINNQAWEEDDIIKGIKIAYQALEASPFCADALNYLSLYSKLYSEKCFLSKRAVLVGKEALGELYIKENTGYFWGLLETRPYMRALQGLADCYWHTEDLKPAAEIYQEMLKLNPSDNQGVRYHLGNILILLDRREELDDLLKNYGEEESCFMLYTKALHLYRLGSADATKIVQRAIASNKHVYEYLSGEEFMPYREPEHYCWGEPSEAICYVSDAQEAWEKSPDSIEWLNKNMQTFQQNLMAAEQEVTIEQVLQNFLEEQSSHLSKTTYRKYETVIELLEASMERYSYNYLEENDKQIFDLCLNDQFNKALDEEEDDDDNNLFCRLFGPTKIASGAVEFLSYFLPHKVGGSKDLLKKSATVIKKLGQWLFSNGYIDQTDLERITEEAINAGRELPAINDFEVALFDYLEETDIDAEWDEEDELEDVFEVISVKPGVLTLETYGAEGKIELAVKVPQKLSKMCSVGWQMNLLLVKTKNGWIIAEAGRVSY